MAQQCPLCGGKACPQRIGYYKRKKVIIGFVIYYNFPIARYRCQRKGAIVPGHRTFSLLPHWLVPYRQHACDAIIETVKHVHQSGDSLEQTKQVICNQGRDTDIPLDNQQILDFTRLCGEGFHKLCATPALKRQLQDSRCFNSQNPVDAVLNFIGCYQSPLTLTHQPNVSNIEKLRLDFFYHFQTGPYFQRLFLFGTPSQRR
jgi:hypothetical protein